MSRAKESFLERLKREREEAQRPKSAPAPREDNYEEETEFYRETYAPLPKIEKEVSSEESSSEEEEEIPVVPVRKVQQKPEFNGYSVGLYDFSKKFTNFSHISATSRTTTTNKSDDR